MVDDYISTVEVRHGCYKWIGVYMIYRAQLSTLHASAYYCSARCSAKSALQGVQCNVQCKKCSYALLG